jgi:hypothetical protein
MLSLIFEMHSERIFRSLLKIPLSGVGTARKSRFSGIGVQRIFPSKGQKQQETSIRDIMISTFNELTIVTSLNRQAEL